MIARLAIVAAALASVAAPALAAGPGNRAVPEVRIREIGARLETVNDPGRGVYIRDVHGRWFYARAQDNCPRLTYTASLRLNPSPGGYFDNRSMIVADGWRCFVASVTPSGGPPRHHRG
jgi:hypothetical protein